jgi:hypothetical protein
MANNQAIKRGMFTMSCCQEWEDHLDTLMYALHLPTRQVVIGEAVAILSELADCPAPPRLQSHITHPQHTAKLDRRRLKKRVVGD